MIESYNTPVMRAVALVMPLRHHCGGHEVVVVVPRAKAEPYAAAAHKIQEHERPGAGGSTTS
jgi:hypothetical protein